MPLQLFVTGATGFVGSHFVQQALRAGHSVRGIGRPGSLPRIPIPQPFDLLPLSLDALESPHFEGIDCLVHFASHTPNPPYASLPECLYWNVFQSARVFAQAAEAGVKRFLVAGSCFEYGLSAIGHSRIHPGTELRPNSTYSISKAAASTALLGFARERAVQLQLLRIFQVFGEGEPAFRFYPSLKRAALAGADFEMTHGLQVRDFIPVSDVAARFLQALDFQTVETGRPLIRNVGTGTGTRLVDFAQAHWSQWNAPGTLKTGVIPARTEEIPQLVADIDSTHLG
jgi:nucleoside-diphosphate-sugar epimerase